MKPTDRIQDSNGTKGTVVQMATNGQHGIVAWEIQKIGLWFAGFEVSEVRKI